MNNKPRATVALLTYNSAGKLGSTLDALLAQTVNDVEILIQDDGSSDETLQIAETYARRDPGIRVETTPTNLGGWRNFTLATARARGKYVMWACPGDIYRPTFIEATLDRLSEVPGAVAATSMSVVIDRRTQRALYVNDFGGQRNPELYSGLALAKRILVKARPNEMGRAAFGSFIHGLINRDKLQSIFECLEKTGPILNDRVILCQLALTGYFVVVKDILFEREFHEAPAIKRNSNDPGLQISAGPILTFYPRAVRQILSSFRRSRVLTRRQKILVIPLVGHYLRRDFQHLGFIATVAALHKILPRRLYDQLRREYRKTIRRQ